jgi:TRAP-type transport system large permease protein
VVFVVLAACLLAGVPIAFAIVAALVWFMAAGDPPYHIRIVASEMFRGLNSFPLLAIPLFVLAGELMNASGITQRIIAFANVIVGGFRAGLAHVNIWASVIFAGLSGSAVADTSALGRVFIPEMEKHGYDRSFAAALTAASSVIGPIIPPSIPVIIYALIVTGVSVPALFLAGVVPGLLLAVFLSAYVALTVKVKDNRGEGGARGGVGAVLLGGVLPLLMPVFVVGSILLGVVTPTEAASFAVGYALLIGLFVFRSLKVSALPGIFTRAMCDSAVIMIIIAAIAAANWLLTYNRVPNVLTDWVLGNVDSRTTFLIAAMLLFMKTSIATVCISGDLREKLAAIASAGFDGVEIFENDFLAFDGTPAEVGRMIRDHGLEITLFQPFRDFEGMPEPQRSRAFDRAERKFDLMQELGTT